jgi:hypothetical protein
MIETYTSNFEVVSRSPLPANAGVQILSAGVTVARPYLLREAYIQLKPRQIQILKSD